MCDVECLFIVLGSAVFIRNHLVHYEDVLGSEPRYKVLFINKWPAYTSARIKCWIYFHMTLWLFYEAVLFYMSKLLHFQGEQGGPSLKYQWQKLMSYIFSLFLDAPFLCYTDNSVILWIVLVIRSSVTTTMWFLWSFYKMLAVITGQTPDLFSRWLWLLLLETRTVAHTTVILDLEFRVRVGKCSCLSPQAKGNLENGEKYLTIPVQCTAFHIGKYCEWVPGNCQKKLTHLA